MQPATCLWLLPAGNAVAYFINVIFGAVQGPKIGPMSDNFLTPITPPDYTFAIWSVIYIWQLLFVIYGLVRHENAVMQRTGCGPWFIASYTATAVWYWTFPYGQMEVAAIACIAASICLYYGVSGIQSTMAIAGDKEILDHLLAFSPASINFAWLMVAAVLSFFCCLSKWVGNTHTVVVMSQIAIALLALKSVIFVAVLPPNPTVPLVFCWPIISLLIEATTTGNRVMNLRQEAVFIGVLIASLLCCIGAFIYGCYRHSNMIEQQIIESQQTTNGGFVRQTDEEEEEEEEEVPKAPTPISPLKTEELEV